MPRQPEEAAIATPRHPLPADLIAEIAQGGAHDAGGLPVELLGDFLSVVADAVLAGRTITARQLRAYSALGDSAAQQGIALRALLDLYLSSAWRIWRHLPTVANAAADPEAVVVAGEVMLHAVDDVVAALAEGYQLARRALVRAQESARREFIDDLLSGAADLVGLLARADGFGLDLSGPHAVAVVRSQRRFADASPLLTKLERAVRGAKGDAQILLASKDGRIVVIFPAPDAAAISQVQAQLSGALGRRSGPEDWQMSFGRTGIGADGVASSYRESLESLTLADRLGLAGPIVDARDLLVYQVLLRDRPALVDLVNTTLDPLRSARGGAQPLLDTLEAYFASGGNTAQTSRALHLSIRAVTYRLSRIAVLTSHDPTDPADRFSLQVAVLGARLLDWPGAAPL